MGANWNYALLSKMAKKAGGPEVLLEMIKREAIAVGKKKMAPFVAIAGLGGIGLGIGIKAVIDAFKNTKSEENVQALSSELIEGIKKYDNEHPGETEGKQMINNPFREASYLSFNEKTSELLEKMACDWDVMTDFGNSPTEEDLIVVVTNHDAMKIYSYYIVNKNGESFDADALEKAIEQFRIESDI